MASVNVSPPLAGHTPDSRHETSLLGYASPSVSSSSRDVRIRDAVGAPSLLFDSSTGVPAGSISPDNRPSIPSLHSSVSIVSPSHSPALTSSPSLQSSTSAASPHKRLGLAERFFLSQAHPQSQASTAASPPSLATRLDAESPVTLRTSKTLPGPNQSSPSPSPPPAIQTPLAPHTARRPSANVQSHLPSSEHPPVLSSIPSKGYHQYGESVKLQGPNDRRDQHYRPEHNSPKRSSPSPPSLSSNASTAPTTTATLSSITRPILGAKATHAKIGSSSSSNFNSSPPLVLTKQQQQQQSPPRRRRRRSILTYLRIILSNPRLLRVVLSELNWDDVKALHETCWTLKCSFEGDGTDADADYRKVLDVLLAKFVSGYDGGYDGDVVDILGIGFWDIDVLVRSQQRSLATYPSKAINALSRSHPTSIHDGDGGADRVRADKALVRLARGHSKFVVVLRQQMQGRGKREWGGEKWDWHSLEGVGVGVGAGSFGGATVRSARRRDQRRKRSSKGKGLPELRFPVPLSYFPTSRNEKLGAELVVNGHLSSNSWILREPGGSSASSSTNGSRRKGGRLSSREETSSPPSKLSSMVFGEGSSSGETKGHTLVKNPGSRKKPLPPPKWTTHPYSDLHRQQPLQGHRKDLGFSGVPQVGGGGVGPRIPSSVTWSSGLRSVGGADEYGSLAVMSGHDSASTSRSNTTTTTTSTSTTTSSSTTTRKRHSGMYHHRSFTSPSLTVTPPTPTLTSSSGFKFHSSSSSGGTGLRRRASWGSRSRTRSNSSYESSLSSPSEASSGGFTAVTRLSTGHTVRNILPNPHALLTASMRSFAPIFRVYVPCTEMVNDGDVVGKCERQLAIGGVWDFLEVGDLVINLGYVPAVGGSSAFGSSASRNGSKSGGGSPARSGSPSEVGFTRERAVRFADAIASRRSALPSGIKDKLDEVPHHHHHHHIDHRHHHQGHQHGEASDPDDPIWLIFNGSKLVPFNPRRSPPPLSPNNDPRTWSSIAKIPCPTYYSHVIGRVAGVGSASMAMIDPLHRIVIPKVQRGSSGIGTSSDDRSTWRRRKVARLNGVESEAGKLFDVVSLEGNIGGAAVSVDAEGAEFNFIELKSDVVRTRALGPARIVNRLAWIARFEVYQDDYGRDGDGRRVDLGDGWAGEWFLEAEGTPEGMKKLKGALEGKESFLWRVLLDRCVKGSVWLRFVDTP